MKITISMVRHGEKDGDQLTEKGKKQIRKTIENIVCMGASPDLIAHSPANRTMQCAKIAEMIISNNVSIIEEKALSPGFPILKTFDFERDFEEEFKKIMELGGTVADALRIGKYPAVGRAYLNDCLLGLADRMIREGKREVICFSHSPYTTLGGQGNGQGIPYHISEAGLAVYLVDTSQKTIELKGVFEQ